MKYGRHSLESPTVPAQEQQYRGEPMPVKNDVAMVPTVIAGAPATMLPRKEMTVQDLWGILSRRRGILLGCLVVTIGLATALFATAIRLYKGAAVIQIQKE